MSNVLMDILRMEQVLSVLELRRQGKSIQEACGILGFSESSYYRWVARENDAMTIARELMSESQRNVLFEAAQRTYQGLLLVMEDITNPELKAETRIKGLKFLLPLIDELAKVYHAQPGGEDQAAFLKRGPILEPAQSRLATIDVKSSPDGVRIDILQDQPIVDLVARDLPEVTGETEAARLEAGS